MKKYYQNFDSNTFSAVKMPDFELNSSSSLVSFAKEPHLSHIPIEEMLAIAVRLTLNCLHLKGNKEDPTVIGHMIILMQADWSLHFRKFQEFIEKILILKNFSYADFLDFVFQIEILEEFAYLNEEDVGVTLAFLPSDMGVIK